MRLIYRMSYTIADPAFPKPLSSRMPFNINVVYAVPKPDGGDCASPARGWIPDALLASPRERAQWLTAGPLDRKRLVLKQIEVNAQIVRFPSGQETEFGGQAAYVMRVFRADTNSGALKLSPKPLENTPDVARLKSDSALRARLADFLRANTTKIDRGVFVVPDEFLATKAISFSTFGSARLANHPYAQLFSDKDFASVTFDRRRQGRCSNASTTPHAWVATSPMRRRDFISSASTMPRHPRSIFSKSQSRRTFTPTPRGA
ncbi:MAG: hypothetical protein ABWZ80_11060, partial [Beijerinckiaceae bacterium]